MIKNIIRPFAAVCCALLLSGCEREESFVPSEIVVSETPDRTSVAERPAFPASSCGVELQTDAKRVVSLSPAATEIICELGFKSRLVGISNYCDYPEGLSLPKVGSTENPDLDKIKELAPDAVFALSALSERDAYALGQEGIAVLTPEVPASMEAYSALYREISAAFYGRELAGGAKEIEKAAQIGSDARVALEKAAKDVELGTFVYITGKLTAAGSDTFESAVLSLCGENLRRESGYADLSGLPDETPDYIIADDSLSYDDVVNSEKLSEYIFGGAAVRFVSSSCFERPSVRTAEVFARIKSAES